MYINLKLFYYHYYLEHMTLKLKDCNLYKTTFGLLKILSELTNSKCNALKAKKLIDPFNKFNKHIETTCYYKTKLHQDHKTILYIYFTSIKFSLKLKNFL